MIITYTQLLEIFGGSSTAQLIIRLNNAGIRYCIGKRNQPFTTMTALNFAMGINQEQVMLNIASDALQQKEHIEIEV